MVGSIVDPSQLDFYSITIPTDQVISVSVAPIAPVGPSFQPAWRIRDHLLNAIPGPYGSFSVWGAHVLVGPLPASGSPYRLEVGDQDADATGSYAVGFSRIAEGKACESFNLACDVPHPDSLGSIIDSDLFRFSAADGETVSVTVVGEPPVQAAWRVLKADGTPVAGFEVLGVRPAATDCGPLSTAGSPYRIEVADATSEATGRYRVYLQRVTALAACEGTSLACDAAVSDSLQSPEDTDLFSFSVTHGEIVSVTVVGEPPVQAAWRLLKGSGAPVPGFGAFTMWPAATTCGPLSAAGNPYRIEVADAGNDDTGRYRVYLQRLTAPTACESTPLPCDTVIVAALDDSVATNLYRFDANGDVVSISVTPQSGGDPDFQPAWRVLDRAGMPLVGFGGGLSPYGYSVMVGPLSVAGNPYRVQVGDYGTNATGAYDVRLERLTAGAACEGTGLACDVVVSDSLQSREDSDLFSFSATNGEIVSVTVVGDPPVQAAWRLLAGSGTPVAGFEGFAVRAAGTDCGPLSTAGNPYRIEVADAGADATGRYRVYLQRVTALSACENRALQCGELVTGFTENSLDTDLLSFSVVAGEEVRVSVYALPGSGSQYEPAWRLLDVSGSPVGPCGSFERRDAYADCGILSPFASPYVVQVGDASQNDVGQYEVVVNCTRTTSVEGTASSTFELGQNRPNPFTPQTTIPFALAFPVHVILKVYDVSGAEVATLADRDMRCGFHSIPWDARGLRSGVYFYRIRAGSFQRTKQLMIVR
ncbi:MAG TPA: T9SS type A sorting domain-containing protein [Candidatus Eisenbacteria bacterium]